MRDHLMEKLQPLWPHFQSQRSRAGEVTVGSAQARDKPEVDRVTAVKNTIGIVFVAAFAARTEGVVGATITATWRRTRSTANSGNLSFRPSAQRYSIATFWSSIKPVAFNPPETRAAGLHMHRVSRCQ